MREPPTPKLFFCANTVAHMLIRSSPTWIATPEHPLFCTIKEKRYPNGYPVSIKTTHQVRTIALRTEYTKERKNEHTLVYQLECTFVEQPKPQILTLSEEDDCIFSVLDNPAKPHPILTTLPQVSRIHGCVTVEGDLLPLYATTPYPQITHVYSLNQTHALLAHYLPDLLPDVIKSWQLPLTTTYQLCRPSPSKPQDLRITYNLLHNHKTDILQNVLHDRLCVFGHPFRSSDCTQPAPPHFANLRKFLMLAHVLPLFSGSTKLALHSHRTPPNTAVSFDFLRYPYALLQPLDSLSLLLSSTTDPDTTAPRTSIPLPPPEQHLSSLFHQPTQHPLSVPELHSRIQRLVAQLTVQQLLC